MLNELMEMLGGDNEDGERGCCQERQPRANGVRGFITRLFSGDDDDGNNDRGGDGRCCSGATGDRDARRRDRDDQNDGLDFGD